MVCFRGFHYVCLIYSLGGCCAALGLVRVVAKQRERTLTSALLRASAWQPLAPELLSASE